MIPMHSRISRDHGDFNERKAAFLDDWIPDICYERSGAEETMKRCHSCGKEVEIKKILGRKEACPFCRSDLRCCLNCAFYDPAAYNACRESQAERVLEKERSNFCDYFVYKNTLNANDMNEAKAKTYNTLNALFKND
jgi:hypothetical protein